MSNQPQDDVVRSGVEWRSAARDSLPRFLFDYIDGSAGGGITTARNHVDLATTILPQAVLADVGDIELSTDLFGEESAMPVALGPVGLAGLYSRRGEVAAARAARDAGIPFSLSTLGVCSVEEVATEVSPPWFQLYVMRDRSFFRELLAKVAEAGCSTLVLTADVPVPGIRHSDRLSGLDDSATFFGRLRLCGQAALKPGWAWNVGLSGQPHHLGNIAAAVPEARGLSDYWPWIGKNFDPSVDWRALDEVRSLWSGTLLIKGVLEVTDARAAIAAGVDGIVISNHGGRQLDGARSTAAALREIRSALGGDIRLLVDGAIRSGSDVARYIALGADACLLGRLWAYALASGGQQGVSACLAGLRKELMTTLALCGVKTPAALRGRSLQTFDHQEHPCLT